MPCDLQTSAWQYVEVSAVSGYGPESQPKTSNIQLAGPRLPGPRMHRLQRWLRHGRQQRAFLNLVPTDVWLEEDCVSLVSGPKRI